MLRDAVVGTLAVRLKPTSWVVGSQFNEHPPPGTQQSHRELRKRGYPRFRQRPAEDTISGMTDTAQPRIELATRSPRVNVADCLREVAAQRPQGVAIACPGRGDVAGRNSYTTCTFQELDQDATSLAHGFAALGVQPGMRMVLLVQPGVEFVKLVFALLRVGATTVLVDPGMGRRHLVNCLSSAEPEGFVAISPVQAVRTMLRHRFGRAERNVTVGRRWFWGGTTYSSLLELGRRSQVHLPDTYADDPAAIIFTSGSTGPPKGVLYTHEMFLTQANDIQRHYGIQPGGADLACFALFGLFNSAMGVTTVFPKMDFSRPAAADPKKLLATAHDWQVTQAFASPAVWNKLSQYCAEARRAYSDVATGVFLWRAGTGRGVAADAGLCAS